MELSEILGGPPVAIEPQRERSGQLGQTDFLRMLIAQLENQDPLDPQDATEFTAQLSQFSSLDQLVSMRTSIDALTGATQSRDQLAVASLIGRPALVESDRLTLPSGEDAPLPTLELELAEDTQIAGIELLQGNQVVATARGIGTLGAGRHAVDWRAFDRVPGAGTYRVRVTPAAGNPMPTSLIRAEVTGAALDPSGTALRLGGIEVPLSALREIGAAPNRDS